MEVQHVQGTVPSIVVRFLPVFLIAAGLLALGNTVPSQIEPFCNDIMNWGGAVVPFLVGIAGLWIHRKLLPPGLVAVQRHGWCLICLGLLSWSLAQGLWLHDELVAGTPAPFPGVPDFAYFGAYPLFLAGGCYCSGGARASGAYASCWTACWPRARSELSAGILSA